MADVDHGGGVEFAVVPGAGVEGEVVVDEEAEAMAVLL
jgi:hypothetical protein